MNSAVSIILGAFPEEVRELANVVREYVSERLVNIEELPDFPARMVAYGYGKGYSDTICTLLLSQKGVKLGFYKGANLPDPDGRLTGTGKVHRYVDIRSTADLDASLDALLEAAMFAYEQRKQPDTGITISTENEMLQPVFIHHFLSQTYWAEGRTLEEVETIIEHSFNFGVYTGTEQIGYARVVTDFVQFAYLLDVFIVPEHRGKGYAKQLMAFILRHAQLEPVKTWRLSTKDAHGLYEKFGFRPLAHPENLMEWIR